MSPTNTRWMTGLFAAALVASVGLGGAGAAFASATTDESAEIASVLQAKTGPAAAVRAAEASAGGRAVSMGLEQQGNAAAFYEVLVASHGGLQEIRLDPASGAVQGTTPANAHALETLQPSQLGQATAAPVTLADAIGAAEHAAGGRALEAGYTIRQGHPVVDVEVATKEGLRQVSVDGANKGQVTVATASGETGEGAADND